MQRAASIVAFLLAAGVVLQALTGPILALPLALIPAIAGIGIRRGRASSAYGFGIYSLAPLLIVLLVFYRNGPIPGTRTLLITSAVWSVLVGAFFLLAGRSLARSGAPRGPLWPWIALSALVTLPFVFVQMFRVPTSSMEPTLLIGDAVVVWRFPEPTPRSGDLFAMFSPADRSQAFLKRIVGMPGDRIRLAHKLLYRNGSPVSEAYAIHTTAYEDPWRDNFPNGTPPPLAATAVTSLRGHIVNGEIVVPPGKYFVLGDNRDNSLDSRYFGFVDSHDLIGRPVLIYDSEQPPAAPRAPNRLGWSRIRWNRLLKTL